MSVIYINGKFTAQRVTGVQRVAAQLVLALDAQLGAGERWVLLRPPEGRPLPLGHIEQHVVGRAGWPLHVWEQWTLPRAAAGGLLVNLSGSAPWFARRQTAMLHDAAVFDHPEAYSKPFVAWYRLLFRHLAQRAEQLFTVSNFSRDRLAASLGVPPTRLVVVPNGADHLQAVMDDDGVLRRNGLQDTLYLLAVASANPTKNLAALVAAFTRVAEPGLKLVIAGGCNERVFAEAHAKGDPPGVVRLGVIDDDSALKALYRHALALVFPSTYEGFGLPPVEAMSCGCPVAAARAAALPETCADAALYFDPHDLNAIVATLRALLADAALRERLCSAGTDRAAAFRWDASAAALRAGLPEVNM